KVVSVDISAAEKMPGVKAVHVIQEPGSEIQWAGDDVVVVAAIDEPSAADAIRAVKVEYQPLPHFVNDFKQPKDIPTDKGPLTVREINQMSDDDVPSDKIIAAIKERGLETKITPQIEARMRTNEDSEAVIAAAKAAEVKEGPKSASPYKKAAEQIKGDPVAGFQQAEVVSEGVYGCPVITHCCLESHGSIAEWNDDDH